MSDIKDRKRVRFDRSGIIRLGYRVFYCDNGHVKAPTRWNGNASQACGICGKMRTGLSERSGVSPYQPGHFVLRDAPEILKFYEGRGVPEAEIRELDIMFPFAERNKNFIANYQVWTASTVVCEGDGEYVGRANPFKLSKSKSGYLRIQQDTGATLISNGMACRSFDWNGAHFEEGDHVPCSGSGEQRLYPHCALCKLNSLIKVMMVEPELFDVGYYQIATGSGNNYDAFDTMFNIMPPNVQGIPFRLQMRQGPTQYRGDDGKIHKTKKWFLYIKPMRDDLRRMFEQNAARQIGQGGTVEEVPQLEAGPAADEYVIEEPEYIQSGDVTVEDDAPFDGVDEPGAVLEFESWAQLKEQAVERLGYKHAKHVTNALKAIFNGNSESLTYDVAWTALVEYQESKNAD